MRLKNDRFFDATRVRPGNKLERLRFCRENMTGFLLRIKRV